MADEILVTEVTAEDKIATLKTTLAGMELSAATIPQEIKDAITQEIATLEAETLAKLQEVEAKAKADEEVAKTKVSDFWVKNRTIIYIVAALVILHVAEKFGW